MVLFFVLHAQSISRIASDGQTLHVPEFENFDASFVSAIKITPVGAVVEEVL